MASWISFLWTSLTLLSIAKTQEEAPLAEYVVSECYGDLFSFDCGSGHKIRIKRDFFGMGSDSDTCHYRNGDCIISNPKSNSLIHRYCTGRHACTYYLVERRGCNGYFSNYQQVEYQCVPDTSITNICSNIQYESDNTYIASPNFPDNYPPNLTCSCLVSPTTPGVRVTMEILYLAIKYNSPCQDWLRVGRRRTCGTSSDLFSGSRIPIEFHSDESESHSGFWLNFKASKPGEKLLIQCSDTNRFSNLRRPGRLRMTIPRESISTTESSVRNHTQIQTPRHPRPQRPPRQYYNSTMPREVAIQRSNSPGKEDIPIGNENGEKQATVATHRSQEVIEPKEILPGLENTTPFNRDKLWEALYKNTEDSDQQASLSNNEFVPPEMLPSQPTRTKQDKPVPTTSKPLLTESVNKIDSIKPSIYVPPILEQRTERPRPPSNTKVNDRIENLAPKEIEDTYFDRHEEVPYQFTISKQIPEHKSRESENVDINVENPPTEAIRKLPDIPKREDYSSQESEDLNKDVYNYYDPIIDTSQEGTGLVISQTSHDYKTNYPQEDLVPIETVIEDSIPIRTQKPFDKTTVTPTPTPSTSTTQLPPQTVRTDEGMNLDLLSKMFKEANKDNPPADQGMLDQLLKMLLERQSHSDQDSSKVSDSNELSDSGEAIVNYSQPRPTPASSTPKSSTSSSYSSPTTTSTTHIPVTNSSQSPSTSTTIDHVEHGSNSDLLTLGIIILCVCLGLGLICCIITTVALYIRRKKRERIMRHKAAKNLTMMTKIGVNELPRSTTNISTIQSCSTVGNRSDSVDSTRDLLLLPANRHRLLLPTSCGSVADSGMEETYRRGRGHQSFVEAELSRTRDRAIQVSMDKHSSSRDILAADHVVAKSKQVTTDPEMFIAPKSGVCHRHRAIQVRPSLIDLKSLDKPEIPCKSKTNIKRRRAVRKPQRHPSSCSDNAQYESRDEIYTVPVGRQKKKPAVLPKPSFPPIPPPMFSDTDMDIMSGSDRETNLVKTESMASMPGISEMIFMPESENLHFVVTSESANSQDSDWETRSAISL